MRPGLGHIFSATVACILVIRPAAGQIAPQVSAAALPRCVIPVSIDREFIVFFDPHSTQLSDRGRQILDELVRLGREDRLWLILEGSTDRAETGPSDDRLALRRAESVQVYLEAQGLSSYRIVRRDVGERRLVPTNPGIAEPQNRSVRIGTDGLGQKRREARVRDCATWITEHCLAGSPNQVHQECTRAIITLTRFGLAW